MSLRHWIVVLWLALGVSLPGSAHLKLCFCDGWSGLWTPGSCAAPGRADSAPAKSCCAAAGERGAVDEPAVRPESPQVCACVSVQTQPGVGAPGCLRDGGVLLHGVGAGTRSLQQPTVCASRAGVLPTEWGRSNAPLRVPLRI